MPLYDQTTRHHDGNRHRRKKKAYKFQPGPVSHESTHCPARESLQDAIRFKRAIESLVPKHRYDDASRRGAKAVARNEYANSPRWFVPVLSTCTIPHCGREAEVRSAFTSEA